MHPIQEHQHSETNTNRIRGGKRMQCIHFRNFNTPLIPKDRSTGQKISKDTEALNNTVEQMDLIDTIELYIQKQQNIHSSQVHMEHSPE